MKTTPLSQWLFSGIAILGFISVVILPAALHASADTLSAKEWIHVLNDPTCAPNGPEICDLGGDAIATGVACIPICVLVMYILAIVIGHLLKVRLRRCGLTVQLWQVLGIALGGSTLGHIALVAYVLTSFCPKSGSRQDIR
jgi:hypothetical protein